MDYKTNLSKFKTIEITQIMFSDHNGIRLETDNKYNRKISKHLEIKQHIST